jgi:DHA2 family multidrug resistance protein-like MFS transporter
MTDVRAGRREWIGLAVLALPTLLVSIDVFVLLLALPKISESLHASSTQQLWIMDIYGFLLSGFLITMGTAGDRIGHRRLLLLGAAAFGAASVASAYSTTPAMLILARAALGIAGATLMPSSMALITGMFRDPRQRAHAISIWMVCFMAGAAIGPVVGGAMLDAFWWGSVFLLGVPAMALLLLTGPVLLPARPSTAPAAGRPDLVSVVLSLAGILPLIYGLKEMARDGWSPVSALAVVVGIAGVVAFVRRQRTLADPLLDLSLFAGRAFSTALGTMLANTMLSGAMMLFITQYLQLVRGLSTFDAGLWMLPGVACSVLSSLTAPVLARTVRPAYLISGGIAVTALGLLALGLAPGMTTVVLAFVLINLGGGPAVVLGIDLVVGSAPEGKAGSAAAMNETSGQFGFALGLAILGSLATAVYRSSLLVPEGTPHHAAVSARDTIAGATEAAAGLPGPSARALLHAARSAFDSGMQVTALVCAVLLLISAALTAVFLRHVSPTPPQAAPEPVAVVNA